MQGKPRKKQIIYALHLYPFFSRFISERDNFKAAVNENPLHKSPITKYINPVYEQKDEQAMEPLLHRRKNADPSLLKAL